MDSRVVRCNHLIKKIQKGDEKALDALFQEFGPLFLNMAQKYLYDKSYAEDLVSEVFVDLIRTSARSFDDNKNSLNWFFTIIRRKAYKYNTKGLKDVSIDELDNSYLLTSFMINVEESDSEKSLDIFLLKSGLEKLSDKENKILYYKYWEGLTVREIAKKLGKSHSTIQYIIKEALKKLKEYFDFGE